MDKYPGKNLSICGEKMSLNLVEKKEITPGAYPNSAQYGSQIKINDSARLQDLTRPSTK